VVRLSSDAGLKEFDQKLLKALEEWGWFVLSVGAGDSEPAFSYSIGLYEHFQHPEIILFGLDFTVMHGLINDAAGKIKEGSRYLDRYRDANLLKDYECEFRSVRRDRYEGLLNYALWYYQGKEFPALQLVWPDSRGTFPWESGFDERFRKDQLILF
jgi:hypothetical protein